MKCLISFDGLSSADLIALCNLMPKTKSFIENGDIHVLDNHLLTQPQPIWAEILTGTPWYENGCSAYSRPSGTLNRLMVVTEKELLTRAKLLDEKNGGNVVSINLPIVKSKPPRRLWLSDGSLPTNKQVSPPALLKCEPIKSYESRPFKDIGSAIGLPATSAHSSIAVEKIRIDSALYLLRNFQCDRFILRLTLFDHLYHLLGINYLQTENHVMHDEIVEFCLYLDAAMSEIIAAFAGDVIILSGYSHLPCTKTLSLNYLLEHSGLLMVSEQADETKKQRISVTNVVLGHEASDSILCSYEGQIDAKATVAASPTSGTVYINRSDVFENGSVTPASYEEKRLAVRQLLQKAAVSRFGDAVHIQEAPRESMKIAAPIPEFIVNIDGVEFHNIRDANLREQDTPRTTHSSSGFVVVPKGRLNKDESVKLTDITELFA
jgi:hypothetical protein